MSKENRISLKHAEFEDKKISTSSGASAMETAADAKDIRLQTISERSETDNYRTIPDLNDMGLAKYKIGPKQSVALTDYSYISTATTPPHLQVHIDVDVEYFEEYEEQEQRGNWWHYRDFLLASIASSVGLGNLWMFPYMCYKNGGGAFLVPYILCVCLIGVPMVFLEISLGQYMSISGMQAWNIVPLFQGIGLASAFILFLASIGYVVVISWVLFYIWKSISIELPWKSCYNEWNTVQCSHVWNRNTTFGKQKNMLDPATEFWENRVLMINDGQELGRLNFDLVVCSVITWSLIYCCISKGMRVIGGLSHFTVLAPYVIMLVFIVNNLMLDGAFEGLRFYLSLDLTRLKDMNVWRDALIQVIFSSGIGTGVVICIGSYQPFYHNSYKDSIIISFVNLTSSLAAGFIVFSCLGFMSKQQGKSVSLVAESGPGLVFVTYPMAVTLFPFPPVWSFLFFTMIYLFALDCQFMTTSSIITLIIDQCPRRLRKHSTTRITALVMCCVSHLIGLPMVTQAGMYIYKLLIEYTEFMFWPCIALLECIALMYVYGANRFEENIVLMIGDSWLSRTLPYMKFCWCVIDPLLVFCICMYTFSSEKLAYTRRNRPVYYYASWMLNIGRGVNLLAMLCLPLVLCIKLNRYGVSLRMLKLMLIPYHLLPHQLQPGVEPEPCLKDVEMAYHRPQSTTSSASR